MKNPIKKIDFTELRNQKATLLNVIDGLEKSGVNTPDLQGIVALIDSIQDYAVDELGINEMLVYDFELEEEQEMDLPEVVFAKKYAGLIFDELSESAGFHQDDEMTREFIASIMSNEYQEGIIKSKIAEQILVDLEKHPSSDVVYDADMRKNYKKLVTLHIMELYIAGRDL